MLCFYTNPKLLLVPNLATKVWSLQKIAICICFVLLKMYFLNCVSHMYLFHMLKVILLQLNLYLSLSCFPEALMFQGAEQKRLIYICSDERTGTWLHWAGHTLSHTHKPQSSSCVLSITHKFSLTSTHLTRSRKSPIAFSFWLWSNILCPNVFPSCVFVCPWGIQA